MSFILLVRTSSVQWQIWCAEGDDLFRSGCLHLKTWKPTILSARTDSRVAEAENWWTSAAGSWHAWSNNLQVSH